MYTVTVLGIPSSCSVCGVHRDVAAA
jgi:hypothetical protein